MATPNTSQAIAKCRKAAMALGYRHTHFLLIHDRMAYRECSAIPTMGVTEKGLILINPAFVATLSQDELSGCIAHEMLHPTLRHFERAKALGIVGADGKIAPGREEDASVWNDAGDWCINHALRSDGIKLPRGVLFPDPDYLATGGPIQSEPIYHWIKAQQRQGQQPQGLSDPNAKPSDKGPGQGCGVLPSPPKDPGQAQPSDDDQGKLPGLQGAGPGQGGQGKDPGDEQGDKPYGLQPGETWEVIAAQARAHAQMIGKGSAGFAALLTPYEPTIDWSRVIRRGFQLAQVRPGNLFSTYSRMSRRGSAGGNVIRPGWYGGVPSIAFVIDVSGSMSREWIAQIVSEILSGMNTFGTRAFLATHTDRLVWSGWVAQGDRDAIVEACQETGGTDPIPAYQRVAEEPTTFEVLVHFTDCELAGWPENPARKLVIGAFGRGAENPYCPTPEGAHVIPCHVATDRSEAA